MVHAHDVVLLPPLLQLLAREGKEAWTDGIGGRERSDICSVTQDSIREQS
jgi:hypothetical protein